MSSGEDRTHHWLLTSPGPEEGVVEDDPMVHEEPSSVGHCPHSSQQLDDPLAPSNSDAPGIGVKILLFLFNWISSSI